jgi:hypothetical protein
MASEVPQAELNPRREAKNLYPGKIPSRTPFLLAGAAGNLNYQPFEKSLQKF